MDPTRKGAVTFSQFRAVLSSEILSLQLSPEELLALWPLGPGNISEGSTAAYTDFIRTCRHAIARACAGHPNDATMWVEIYTEREGMFYFNKHNGVTSYDMPSVLSPPPLTEWLRDTVLAHLQLDDPSSTGFAPAASVWMKLQSSDIGLFLPEDIATSIVQTAQNSQGMIDYVKLASSLRADLMQLYASRPPRPNDWCYMHAGTGRGFFWCNKKSGEALRTTPVDVLVAIHEAHAPPANSDIGQSILKSGDSKGVESAISDGKSSSEDSSPGVQARAETNVKEGRGSRDVEKDMVTASPIVVQHVGGSSDLVNAVEIESLRAEVLKLQAVVGAHNKEDLEQALKQIETLQGELTALQTRHALVAEELENMRQQRDAALRSDEQAASLAKECDALRAIVSARTAEATEAAVAHRALEEKLKEAVAQAKQVGQQLDIAHARVAAAGQQTSAIQDQHQASLKENAKLKKKIAELETGQTETSKVRLRLDEMERSLMEHRQHAEERGRAANSLRQQLSEAQEKLEEAARDTAIVADLRSQLHETREV